MKVNVSEVMDFYAGINISLSDASSYIISPGTRQAGYTNISAGGFVIPFEGCARFTFNGIPYVLEPGMVVHAGPGMDLDKEVIGCKKWHYALIHYQIAEQAKDTADYFNKDFTLPIGESSRIVDIARKLLSNHAAGGSEAALRSRSNFHQLMEEILLSAKRQHCENKGNLIDDVIEYMNENYAQDLSITQIAEHYGLQAKQFSKLFRLNTGILPTKYLSGIRIDHAKELLHHCTCPVRQIAECVGYSDSLYFSKVFKKNTGLSPTEFRQT